MSSFFVIKDSVKQYKVNDTLHGPLKWSKDFSSCITSGHSKVNFLAWPGRPRCLSLVIGEASVLNQEGLH
jgi:hypothetical protein